MASKTLQTPPRRTTRATFSDELRDAIERSDLTPYALGKAAGIDPGILSRFLAGRRGVTSDTIDRIASTLGLHLGTATRGKGRPRSEKLGTVPGLADAPEPESTATIGELAVYEG
jgi:transcriptional regulator with XRE-family HTH domain